jgi:hypothetical protein
MPRRETMEALFRKAGYEALTTQPFPRSKELNILCTPGEGAPLLPSLYESLARQRRRRRIVFAAFPGGEAWNASASTRPPSGKVAPKSASNPGGRVNSPSCPRAIDAAFFA